MSTILFDTVSHLEDISLCIRLDFHFFLYLQNPLVTQNAKRKKPNDRMSEVSCNCLPFPSSHAKENSPQRVRLTTYLLQGYIYNKYYKIEPYGVYVFI